MRSPFPPLLLVVFLFVGVAVAQTPAPEVLDKNLAVRTVVSGLNQPTSIAFLGTNEFFVIEKASGRVQHVLNGTVAGTALDLAVNNNSERGLLGIALDPQFATNHFVYLYWTCNAPVPSDPFFPSQTRCSDTPQMGADSTNVLGVPLLGNRVDRFVWNGTSLTFDRNLIMLHSFQADGAPQPPNQGDETQPARGNHNAGVIRFGPDGKLYIIIGDNGRRGALQNLPNGPLGDGSPDDQFGGPAPDDAHVTGAVFRLNSDGSTPTDNPFFAAGGAIGGEVGANIQKLFAYGIRNGFGMAFDPISGSLWVELNGDDTYDEIEMVDAGHNGGWVQIMGPASRVPDFKAIEVSLPGGLQQLRWPPANIADTPQEALSRLYMLPGAKYSDPEFSWRFAVAPAAIGFLNSRALGPQYEGDMFVGASRLTLENGYLFRLQLTGNRRKIAVDDPRLEDRVADNTAKFDITESESLLFGRNFGIGTDIVTGPNGNLYVVSLSNGAVYEIYRKKVASS
ncbi:MAG TPA: PQQ-dependent sugar dehydrogenase [Terriglobales bacterium]|nr:PQQ-dependent sugar dehydrogenase [Terriglobales bacterium]